MGGKGTRWINSDRNIGKMNNIFFTADNHYQHEKIIKLCSRPYNSVEEMDEALIKNWNNRVSRKDTVYIIGDFAYKNHGRFQQQLNGKKILIRGNHDRMSQEQLRNFTEVHDLLDRVIDNTEVIMCHYAMRTWNHSFNGSSFHVYGHSHQRLPEYDDVRSCDVGVDGWEYSPIPWEVLKDKMNSKKKKEFFDSGESERNIETNRAANLELLRKHGLAG